MKNQSNTTRQEKFVLLRGIEHGNRFFSMYSGGDPTRSAKGGLWYEVIGWADTVEEAQTKLYGRTFPFAASNPTRQAPDTASSKPESFEEFLRSTNDDIGSDEWMILAYEEHKRFCEETPDAIDQS